ncbi:MAG TPA: HEAT repeat domain-containing protein, partial [Verrucomicrobiae bacterium]
FAEELVRRSNDPNLFPRYAIFTALNRIARGSPEAWPAIIRGLKHWDTRIRESCAFAMRETYDKELVRMLAAALRYASKDETEFKVAVLNVLAPLHHKPPEWNGDWWAYHPFRLSPPVKTNEWEGTTIVFEVLSAAIADGAADIREAAAAGLGQFGTEAAGDLLMARLDIEAEHAVTAAILHALAQMKYRNAAPLAAKAIRDGDLSDAMLSLGKASGDADIVAALEAAIGNNISGAERAIRTLVELGATNSAPVIAAALHSSSTEVRSAALKALAVFRARAAIPAMLRAADDPSVRAEAIQALSEIPDSRAVELFVSGLAEKRVDVRVAAAKGLRGVREEAWPMIEPKIKTLPRQTIAELQRIYRNDARANAAGLNAIQVDRASPQSYFDFVAKNSGDAARGEKIFKDRNGVACINCHRARGDGVDIGPDLSGIGAQFDRAALAESVLFPSRAVREGYNVIEIELNDGDSISGMIRAETEESISLQSAVGAPQTISKSKIKSRKATSVSLMPDGLEAGLSLEEFSDLISFLQSLRSGT